MRISTIIALCFLILFSISSLDASVVGNSDEEVQPVADPILDNILDGMKTEDYSKYTKDFDKVMKKMTEKQFLASNEKILNAYGEYQSREYLGFYTKDKNTIALFKGRFSDTKDDVLIKLVLSKKLMKVVVTGLWFQ